MTDVQTDLLEIKLTLKAMQKAISVLLRKEMIYIDNKMNTTTDKHELKLLHDRYTELALQLLDMENCNG